MSASRTAWAAWFQAWYAAHWRPEDLPALECLILLYDQVRRGKHQRHGELRLSEDTWGITPKGAQDRRWQPPEEPKSSEGPPRPAKPAQYAHLKVVDD